MNGVVFVAYGNAARREARKAITALREVSALPVAVLCAFPLVIEGVQDIIFQDTSFGARLAKLSIGQYAPAEWENVLYLDADTRAHVDPAVLFAPLEDGFDLVISFSENQDGEALQHIGECEREYTVEALCNPRPLQLQAGVFTFRRNAATLQLFEAWRDEWRHYQQQDQAALLRALERVTVKTWIIGRDWNGGDCIEHLFGRARK